MDECICVTPKQYADPRKRFCRVCNGFVSRSSEEQGRLHTRLDAAIASLELPEDELRLFLRYMHESLSEDVRQTHGTWHFNQQAKQRTDAA